MVLGPIDLVTAQGIEYNSVNVDGDYTWNDQEVINGNTQSWEFGFGRYTVSGILAGEGAVDASGNKFIIIAVLDRNGDWVLAFRSITRTPLVIPQGTVCIDWHSGEPIANGRQHTLQEDAPFGSVEYPDSEILANLGSRVTVRSDTNEYRTWERAYLKKYLNPTDTLRCAYPYVTDRAGSISVRPTPIQHPRLPSATSPPTE